MKAELMLNERITIGDDAFAQLRVWRVPVPVHGSSHIFKYSLAYVVDGDCVLRFDNEAGKGDHYHEGEIEGVYAFTTPERLLSDFWIKVDEWRT
jgi:hypothetical protein